MVYFFSFKKIIYDLFIFANNSFSKIFYINSDSTGTVMALYLKMFLKWQILFSLIWYYTESTLT